MQRQLDAMGLPVRIQILGVNQRGYDVGNESFTANRTLPLLQEGANQDVWGAWGVVYRDVVIVDRQGRRVDVFNLTTYDLSNPAHFMDLRTRLINATMR